jgi:transcriptional regulator with XRE-family HTH domain
MKGRAMTRKPDPLDVEVGRKVRALRLNKNMSQERLAEALGLTFQQVQKYERGTNRISAGRLQRIAKILDVQTAVFFPDTKEAARTGSSTLFDLVDSAAALRLLRAYSRIPTPELKRIVASLAEELAATDQR